MYRTLIFISVLLLKYILSADSVSYILAIVRKLDTTTLSNEQKRNEVLNSLQHAAQGAYQELNVKESLLNLAIEIVVNYAKLYKPKDDPNAP